MAPHREVPGLCSSLSPPRDYLWCLPGLPAPAPAAVSSARLPLHHACREPPVCLHTAPPALPAYPHRHRRRRHLAPHPAPSPYTTRAPHAWRAVPHPLPHTRGVPFYCDPRALPRAPQNSNFPNAKQTNQGTHYTPGPLPAHSTHDAPPRTHRGLSQLHHSPFKQMQGPQYAMLVHLAMMLSTSNGWVLAPDDKAHDSSPLAAHDTGEVDGGRARRQLASGCSGSWSACPHTEPSLAHQNPVLTRVAFLLAAMRTRARIRVAAAPAVTMHATPAASRAATAAATTAATPAVTLLATAG